MERSSLLNIGIIFVISKLVENVQDENDKLFPHELGLLSAVWNNFRNLLGMLEGPADLLFFSSFITDNAWSLLVGVINKELAFPCLRYSE